ncbi:multicopper oxidase domain-containing protein [Streptomyces sp. NPDC048277]|uniref:multicopper oxidase domain-containing protein n=1 Tax=Streptomyces sp. NPDC048277 TaxID=3155027 RepID=UPI003410B158
MPRCARPARAQVPGPTAEVRRGQRVRIAWTNRFPKGIECPVTSVQVPLRTDGRPQASTEPGREDVFRVPGGQVLRVRGRFDGAYGRFMYHCHLLGHEDMGMMRPFVVMPEEAMRFDHGEGRTG